MTLETILAYTAAITIFAASPGPGVFAVIGQSVLRGTSAALLMLTGIIIGDVIFLIGAAAGLGLLAAQMGALFIFIKYLGAGYLVWFGWQSWRKKTASSNTEEAKGIKKHSSVRSSLLAGTAISLSNPKVMVFYLAFLPPFLDLTTISVTDIAVLTSITTAVSYVVLGFYILGAAKLRQEISRPRPQKWFNRISGALMVSAGALVATRS